MTPFWAYVQLLVVRHSCTANLLPRAHSVGVMDGTAQYGQESFDERVTSDFARYSSTVCANHRVRHSLYTGVRSGSTRHASSNFTRRFVVITRLDG
ncbi:hypothetical protein F5Y15DRAFT_395375 [Xylariaceae sp. FL0016]|nr:hypothetical protein F5Y15DRAFT_395375 [Xylariaceae sp. FL0016]